jgi:phosphatidylglycerol:prolipoprotein diacylglycerol transferase
MAELLDAWSRFYLGIGSTIGLGLGRLSNFINGELFGRVSFVPWAMIFPTAGALPRHPSQLYEAFLEGFVLFLILFALKSFKRANGRSSLRDGQLFGCYLFFYGLFRFILEYFREPDPQLGFVFLHFSMGQLLSWVMILSGIVFLGVLHFWKKIRA